MFKLNGGELEVASRAAMLNMPSGPLAETSAACS